MPLARSKGSQIRKGPGGNEGLLGVGKPGSSSDRKSGKAKLKTGENHNSSSLTSTDTCVSAPKLRWGPKGTSSRGHFSTMRKERRDVNTESAGFEFCFGYFQLLLTGASLFLVLEMIMGGGREAGMWREMGVFPPGKPDDTHSTI